MAPPRIGKGEFRSGGVKGIHGVDVGKIRVTEDVPSPSATMDSMIGKWRRLMGTDKIPNREPADAGVFFVTDIGRRFRQWKSTRAAQSDLPREKTPLKFLLLRREFKRFLERAKSEGHASSGSFEKYLPVLKSEDIPPLLELAKTNPNMIKLIHKIAEERPSLFIRSPNNERLLAQFADKYNSLEAAEAIMALASIYPVSPHSLEVAAKFKATRFSAVERLFESAKSKNAGISANEEINVLMNIGDRNPEDAARVALMLESLARWGAELFKGHILGRILADRSGRYDPLISTLISKGDSDIVQTIALENSMPTRAVIYRLFEMAKNGDKGADSALARVFENKSDLLQNDDMPVLFELAGRYTEVWTIFPRLANRRPDLFGSDEISKLIEAVPPFYHPDVGAMEETLGILSRSSPDKFSKEHLAALNTLAKNNDEMAPVLRNLAILGNEEMAGLAITGMTASSYRYRFGAVLRETVSLITPERLRLVSISDLIRLAKSDYIAVDTLKIMAERSPDNFDSEEILRALIAAGAKQRRLIEVIDLLKPRLARHGISEFDPEILRLRLP